MTHQELEAAAKNLIHQANVRKYRASTARAKHLRRAAIAAQVCLDELQAARPDGWTAWNQPRDGHHAD